MATKTQSVEATNANILEAARQDLAVELAAHLPDNVSDDLQTAYNEIMSYAPLRNAIVPEMIQRIGMQTIDSQAWRNPLARFKKNPMRYGATQEETYINMAKGKGYNPVEGYEYAFKQYQSYIMSAYHSVNVKLQYPVTITYDNMRDAFLGETGIRDMMSAKLESAVSAANYDEYLAMKSLIDSGYEKQLLPAVHVDAVTDKDSAESFLVEIRSKVGEFQFPKPENTIAGSTATSKPENLIFVTTPRVYAQIGVKALAALFNISEAEVPVRTVLVDSFDHSQIQGFLTDIRFFNVREQLREFSDQRLANVLSWNYFYNLFEMVSPSPFYPCCVFTTDTIGTDLTITHSTRQTYVKGGDVALDYVVTASDGTYVNQMLTCEIVSGAVQGTYIVAGTLILHASESQTGIITYTVSTLDGSKTYRTQIDEK